MIPEGFDRSKIPHKPGVYLFKNNKGQIIYVGKAIDLFSRVSSYFSGPHFPRTQALVREISDLETIVVESEMEALILEANLIKKHLPLFNIKLTDDKDYLYIKVTKEDYPKIITARKKELGGSVDYFGPFPSAMTVKTTLKRLRRIFPWCSNPIGPKNKDKRPCFYYHLGQCPGACVGTINQEDYKKIIQRFIRFMRGETAKLLTELESEMGEKAQKLNFEEASLLKKTYLGVQYLLTPQRASLYLQNPNFLEEEKDQSLIQLQKDLSLPSLPIRIECYDISNIQGTEATGSLVVLTSGEIDKTEYRRFKIQITGRPNDVGMHQEMMSRRVKHLEWKKPDLIIIDGGRGQVRGSQEELIKAGWGEIPIFGLAKRLEWLYPPEGELIKLSKSSLSLKLLQKIRDEAHRFALTYHRKLRAKRMYN